MLESDSLKNASGTNPAGVKEDPATRKPGTSQANRVWQSLAQSPANIRRKLAVSQPHDPEEQEADVIADRVMRMAAPEPVQSNSSSPHSKIDELQRKCAGCEEEEEGKEKLKRKEDPNQFAEEDNPLPLVHAASESHGQPLDAQTLEFMGPRFDHDFSQVRIQSDARAADSAKSVNALAYTMGNNIVFGKDQYSPNTASGRKLLAHELAHVIQQNGNANPTGAASTTSKSQPIQRKIMVAGKPYTPDAKYLTWLEAKYGKRMVEFINGMHNGGKPPDYVFSSFDQMGEEVRMRSFIIEGIGEVHKSCCGYATAGGDGKLDTKYWEKVGPYQFKPKSPLPAGKDASDAVESIFKSGAGTELECNSMTVAIQYRAMLKMLGATAFNKKFPSGSGVIISPHHTPPAGFSPHPIWDKKLFKTVTITGAADLLPGDWVYFKNIGDYGAKHPGGFWTGEHSLYLGGGKFRGFGVAEMSEAALNGELLKEYNKGLPLAQQKTLADVPGLQNYARRPIIQEILK